MPNVTPFPKKAGDAFNGSPTANGPGESFPNQLFDQGREVLTQFGYRRQSAGDLFEDWAEMWALLKGDFATQAHPEVADFNDLSTDAQEAAKAYMDLRLLADRRLVACEKAHKEFLREGINTELVELYTSAREAYEDTVIEFGHAREALEKVLWP